VLLVLIHLPTNLTTRALAAAFHTSQSTLDPTTHHLIPVLARALRPAPDNSNHPWIIDGTLIPVHDQSITAVSKNYRRSVNTQIIICAHRRRVVVAGQCWPGNRNDVIVARHTVALLLDGRVVLGDGGYRGITSVTTPATRPLRPHHPRRPLPGAPPDQGPRRARHRPAQGLANTATMPPPRRRHQPQPPHHRRTLEPQDPQSITGQLLVT
jgi:hypothetical protein